MDAAILHCTRGAGIWEWASNDSRRRRARRGAGAAPATCPPWRCWRPPTSSAEHLPDLRVRVVNVVDLMRLQPETEHPHGMSDAEFDALFTTDRPVIFAYHGYPWLIHRLTYRRDGHHNIHVRGYKEEGTTTTPVRHGRDERHGPVPPGHGRDRPGPRAGRLGPRGCASRWSTPGPGTAPGPASTARTCPRSPTGPGRPPRPPDPAGPAPPVGPLAREKPRRRSGHLPGETPAPVRAPAPRGARCQTAARPPRR